MTVNSYDKGDRIVISTSTPFQDSAGTAFDPDVVTFRIKAPGSAAVAYVYGTNSNVAKTATGAYTCTIDVETVGDWYYRVEGETSGNDNRGADEGRFNVKVSEF